MTTQDFNQLIDKYLAGQASPAEAKLIDDFFQRLEKKESLQHYGLSETMWETIHDKTVAEKDARNLNVPKRPFFSRWTIAVAASLLIAIFFFAGWQLVKQESTKLIVTSARNGQKSLITLSDGSKVYLNSASSLSYPEAFSADKREIILSGEAFFEVTRDVHRPFVVIAGDVTTTVLGTSFNINAFDKEEVRVTVETGTVQVSSEAGNNSDKAMVILTPNKQAICKGKEIGMNDVDVIRYIAWKDKILFFESTPLDEAAKQIERWYNVVVTFDNQEIRNCQITGQFKDISLQTVLNFLDHSYSIKANFTGQNQIQLSGRECLRNTQLSN